jgi:hypothetical protein
MTNLPRINISDAVLALVTDMGSVEQEHRSILILNTKNRLLRIHEQYIGNLNGCNVRISELLREAIRSNAAAIVLVHNHPSGEVLPSLEDGELTRGAVGAGKLLDIEVMDHVVVGTDGHFSLREQGLGFLTSRGRKSRPPPSMRFHAPALPRTLRHSLASVIRTLVGDRLRIVSLVGGVATVGAVWANLLHGELATIRRGDEPLGWNHRLARDGVAWHTYQVALPSAGAVHLLGLPGVAACYGDAPDFLLLVRDRDNLPRLFFRYVQRRLRLPLHETWAEWTWVKQTTRGAFAKSRASDAVRSGVASTKICSPRYSPALWRPAS